MSNIEHSHIDNHITRIVYNDNEPRGEKLQFICKNDGMLFREIPIIKQNKYE